MKRRSPSPFILPPYADHIGLWRDELRAWVPERIFDAHVHLGPKSSVQKKFTPDRLRQALSTFACLPWEKLSAFYPDLYSGKTLVGLIAFPFPLREVNLDAANDYLIDLMRREPRITGFAWAHPTDTGRTIAACERAESAGVRFRGVKPYVDLLGKSNFDATPPEFIPEPLLEFMNVRGLVMMFHTSGIGVGSREIQDYLRAVAGRYPRIKVVLAHMGRYVEARQFFDFMDSGVWKDCPTLFLDMSSASCPEVYERVLAHHELWPRLIFASDAPFGLITGVERWSQARGAIFIARDHYSWSDPKMEAEFAEERQHLTYNTYHCIQALKEAFTRLGLAGRPAEDLKAAIFSRNAMHGILEMPCD